MYNSNTDSLGLILGVEVFFSIGHCSGALCTAYDKLIDKEIYRRSTMQQNENKSSYTADMNRIKIYLLL